MNKAYKVVRSLLRGQVVTSEIASSCQGKAIKTLVAVAIAGSLAGSALAQNLIVKDQDYVNDVKLTVEELRVNNKTFTNNKTVSASVVNARNGAVIENKEDATFKTTGEGINLVGGSTFINKGKINTDSITVKNSMFSTVVKGGKLNTWAVNVSNGGTLNLLDLNSSTQDGNDAGEKDEFALRFYLALDNGKLLFNGEKLKNIRVTNNNNKDGALDLSNGNYVFESLALDGNGSVYVDDTASLQLGNMAQSGGMLTNEGTLTINTLTLSGGSLTNAGNLTVGQVEVQGQDLAITNTGTIYTTYENLFVKADEGDGYMTSDFVAAFGEESTGDIYETSYKGKLTLNELKAAQKLVSNVVFVNATITADKEGDSLKLSDIEGTKSVQTIATVNGNSGIVSQSTKLGALEFNVNAESSSVSIGVSDSSGTFEIGGNAEGSLITGIEDRSVQFTSGHIVIGSDDKTTALDNDAAVAQGVTLTAKGALTLQGLDIHANSTFNVAQGASVVADYISGGAINIDGGSLFVLASKPVNTTRAVASDSSFKVGSDIHADSTQSQNDVYITFGNADTARRQAILSSLDHSSDQSYTVLYLDRQIDITDRTVNLNSERTDNGLYAGDNARIYANLQSFVDNGFDPQNDSLVIGTESGVIRNLVLTDLTAEAFTKTATGKFKLNVGTGIKVDTVDMGTDFYQGNGNNKGVLTVSVNTDKVAETKAQGLQFTGQLDQALGAMDFSNDLVRAVIFGNRNLTVADVASANAASNMAVAGGTFSTAMDIHHEVVKAVNRRTSLAYVNVSRSEPSTTVWADVIASDNEAKELYGSAQGYESNVYGGMLGFDVTTEVGTVLGAAVHVGTADANSLGSSVKTDSDTDFYGIELYASQRFADFNVQVDLGYIHTDNDLSTKGTYGAFSESLDGDIWTFGVNGELLMTSGALNVVPHIGARVTRIDMDDSVYGAEYDAMVLYQTPVGVTVSGNFETGAWKWSPLFDLSIVPTFGDNDAVANFVGNSVHTRVVDTSPVQATLGVSAQSGAWTMGLNYGLSASGKSDRFNNSWNLNVRFSF
ncbi:MAG: autotransporter domain-containing protein, partial [Sutterellaceae bacterium]|nr:autotransporter domain-containing protein [Sutterellaceae bacterium]